MDEADAEPEPVAGEETEKVDDDAVTVIETQVVVEEEAVEDAKEVEGESAPEPDSGKAPPSEGDQGDHPMNAVVNWIKETELVPSERQEEISKVVKDRLNTALVDYADMDGMAAAIESLGDKVSTWVDTMACEAEKEMVPLIEAAVEKKRISAPPGTVYHVKKGNNNCYRVTRVNVIA